MFSSMFRQIIKIKLVDNPQYTQYFWGPISEIAGKYIKVIEKNKQGDCLCIIDDKGLVDVDHRDIISI